MRDEIEFHVILVAGALVTVGLIVLAGRLVGGGGTSVSDRVVVLRYRRTMRGLAVLVVLQMLVFLSFLVADLLGVDAGVGDRRLLLVVTGISIWGGTTLGLEAFRRCVVLTDDGLRVRGWFGWSPLLRWGDIQSVRHRNFSKTLVVRTATVKVSWWDYLDGIDRFASECRRRLAPDVYAMWYSNRL
jgi:hypothetical protein